MHNDIPEHLRTFRLIGRTNAFRAVRVYEQLGAECIEGHTLDGKRRTAARIVDVTGLGGTYEAPGHEDCGARFNMHAGCVDCCTCAECGFDRAGRHRRATLDRELQQLGAVVIQVQDLPRALDANARGAREVERATRGEEQARSLTGKICGPILDAAHLARVALGEVGR